MDLKEETPETLSWQSARSATAETHLAGLPAREEFARRVEALLADGLHHPVVRRGDRWFQQAAVDRTADQPVIVVRDSPAGTPRVLVDPNALSAQGDIPLALGDMVPSPDGRLLAFTLTSAGAEISELGILDVETGEMLPDRIDGSVNHICWGPDSLSFWFSGREVIDGRFEFPVRQHHVGGDTDAPLTLPSGIMDPVVIASQDGRHISIRTGNTEPRFDWIIRDGKVVPFLRDLPGGFVGEFHGDDFLAIVDHGAPRGRLVRIPVDTASDIDTWTELVGESEEVLRRVAVVDGVIVLGSLREAASRLRLLDLDGGELESIDLGEPGTISMYPIGASHPALAMFAVGDGEISFVRSTFSSSWATYRYLIGERRLELVVPAEVVIDGLVVTTVSATSSDGAPVTAHVVHLAGLDRSVPQPTLLYGYGGFNVSYLPALDASFSAWMQSGGVFVLSHLRGGSEFGAQWWRQGMRETKQRTFDDLYAVAEQLIADGWTTREQLVAKGESNGGLLTGAALVQRPDLWAAVVSDVPILDLVNYDRDPLTYAIGRGEYGDPSVPIEQEWLRAISPAHNVRPADYPATLITGGANDPRCPVWHIRVFVDELERAQQGSAPTLMKVYAGQGHHSAGISASSAKHADWLAFAAFHSGLTR